MTTPSELATSHGCGDESDNFDYNAFCDGFIDPLGADLDQLAASARAEFQVAGHAGFLQSDPAIALKPINVKCVRSRREHLFYQMATRFKHCQNPESYKLYYKHFKLFMQPGKTCECRIDVETFKTINVNLAKFVNVNHLTLHSDDFAHNPEKQKALERALYQDDPWCPCYGTDRIAKIKCSLDYHHENYLCMEDLQAHCGMPCILDVKVGRITHDPMATEAKVVEQSSKYPHVRDFGFRILGMKTGLVKRDKHFGRSLENQEQVFEAIEGFFDGLYHTERKVAVIGKMLDRLEQVLEWFETMNNNQIRFYSSSLLFVYDSDIRDNDKESHVDTIRRLTNSVRVKMIDFAHVFHSHAPPEGPSRSGSSTSIFTSGELNKDDNYLYGLRRLVKFFIMLNRQARIRLQNERQAAGQ